MTAPPTPAGVVDVIVPTRNRAELVAEAVASVRAQSYPGWKLYLVDDASDDGSLSRLHQLASHDERIAVVERSDRGGPQAARQSGFEVSGSPWVALLDSDDLWEPTKLEAQFRHLRDVEGSGQQLDAVVAAYQWIGAGPPRLVVPPAQRSSRIWSTNNLSTLLIRRATLLRAGGFVPPGQRPLTTCEHTELCLRLAQHWKLSVLDQPLVRCREHSAHRASDAVTSRLAAEELALVLDLHEDALERFPRQRARLEAKVGMRYLSAGDVPTGLSRLAAGVRRADRGLRLELLRGLGPSALRQLVFELSRRARSRAG